MPRPASDIPDRILHAARARFLEHGVDGSSLRQIAADAGTSIGMVYYYFKTKDELFLASIESSYAGLVRELAAALDPSRPVVERLRRMYVRFSRLSDEEFEVLQLLLREALVSSQRLQRVVERFQSGHLPLLLELVRDGVEEGSLRDDVHPYALVAATAVLGLFPQLAHQRIRRSQLPAQGSLPRPAEAAEAMLRVLLHGIAAAGLEVESPSGQRKRHKRAPAK